MSVMPQRIDIHPSAEPLDGFFSKKDQDITQKTEQVMKYTDHEVQKLNRRIDRIVETIDEEIKGLRTLCNSYNKRLGGLDAFRRDYFDYNDGRGKMLDRLEKVLKNEREFVTELSERVSFVENFILKDADYDRKAREIEQDDKNFDERYEHIPSPSFPPS